MSAGPAGGWGRVCRVGEELGIFVGDHAHRLGGVPGAGCAHAPRRALVRNTTTRPDPAARTCARCRMVGVGRLV